MESERLTWLVAVKFPRCETSGSGVMAVQRFDATVICILRLGSIRIKLVRCSLDAGGLTWGGRSQSELQYLVPFSRNLKLSVGEGRIFGYSAVASP